MMQRKAGIIFIVCAFFFIGSASLAVHGEMMDRKIPEKGGKAPEDRSLGDDKARTPYGYHMYRDQRRKPWWPDSPAQQGWFCPWCGQDANPRYGSDGGQGGRGVGRPENRYYRGWMLRYMYPWYQSARFRDRGLSRDDARLLLEKELGIGENKQLKIGRALERKTYYEFELLTDEDELLDRVQVHKYTGWFRSAFDRDG